ncbi:MAG: MaoC family dehydratase N-terminal domain-containing protein [Gammaproteobacteria bacterium]|nr:MaoC family dehydratase N-terminal domain-containing protein [Gammaproteobacteria bacterium]MBI5615755.1 MaoC family dehydratase N-terminal domain-containing protein [Gammaproteobacteria bacterium]
MSGERPESLQRGLHFADQYVGRRFRSGTRTITEFDLMSFVTSAGFNEDLFLDAAAPAELGFTGRLVPGALTLAIAEGLVISSGALSGTGMAFLGGSIETKAPVYVGDTLEVWVEVTAARMTSRGDRGVVTTRNEVRNQRGELVLVFTPSRMIKA